MAKSKFFQRRSYTHENANSWERAFGVLLTPFEAFAKKNSSSGILLGMCTIIAIIIANSSWNEGYHHLLATKFSLAFGDRVLNMSLHHWINDGLMAIFFFLVGLEIKRSMLVGELSSIKQAMLPIIAAIGGMVVPACFYYLLNGKGAGAAGWGIPMATDIAFAIAVLTLLGRRVPATMMTILAALAIVDDLGAVLVIAIFYTETINQSALFVALGCFVFMLFLGRFGVQRVWVYALCALVMWVFMLSSGVHATIAGVLAAFATPVSSLYRPEEFSREARKLLDKFDVYRLRESKDFLTSDRLTGVVHTLEVGLHKTVPPLQRLEHGLQNLVHFFIIPLFALTNAGITLELSQMGNVFSNPITLGVILGLVAGKAIGVIGSIMLCHTIGLAKLPRDMRFVHVVGMGLLAGIGFTMSIFIAELAFPAQQELLLYAKTAILFASVLAGVSGFLILFIAGRKRK